MTDAIAPGSSVAARMIAGGAPGWMVVRAGELRAALPIEAVGEVLPMPVLSPVPMAPAWVAGVVSVRGEIVPVVDVRVRLGARADADAEARVVLVAPDESGERVGLVVDQVAGLIDRAGALVEDPVAGRAGGVPDRFVAAIVTGQDAQRVPVLDLAALLNPDIVA